jgi:cytochrome c-type biogenesis protein CcmH/NrfG
LWLQVHRYEDARRAYRRAAEHVGMTARVRLGLARTAARLNDVKDACAQYRGLLTSFKENEVPSEIIEAGVFVGDARCRP